jgi:hypothetical protein
LKEEVYQYHFSFDELNFNEEKLIPLFNDFSSSNYSVLSDAFNLLLPFIKQNCKPVAGFKYFNSQKISFRKNALVMENVQFDLGPIIYRDIKDASELFVFVCTIGKNIEEKTHELFLEGDSLTAFILDRIASELVESTADLLEQKIKNEFLEDGYNLTNRYSPGYCGWLVSEQKKLFSLLPDNFCGVELTESSLMIPIKSISGIYGADLNLIRKDYHCEICDDEFCYKRKSKKDE